ncbi:MAG: serine protease [Asticcacaulis sp.]|uniref:S1C family serine protease n=1 Tax=Asticcacaulis sp. TaxID=1872648 RepID=UPI0039E64128
MRKWVMGTAALLAAVATVLCVLPHQTAAQESSSANQSLSDLVDSDLQPVNSTKALKTSEQSVVRVLVVYRGYGGVPLDTVGMGSGFVVAPGYIVTNYHVVEVPPEASSADIYIVPHKDSGAGYQPVQLMKKWVEGDLALLAAPSLKVPPLKLYLTPYKNERVVTMGYPDVTDHLLNRSGTALLEPADAYVTQGSIALFASTNPDGSRVDTLFHTAPINHGNSGGPLLNECGQVVGVNTWTAPSSVSNAGNLDVSAGQYVATHVSALNTFLSSAGVTPTVVSTPCYAKSEDEIVKDDALSRVLAAAAEAQVQRLAEQKKAEADRAAMEIWQLGAMIVLSVLVLILIGLIIRREIRHRNEIHSKEPLAPTAFDEVPAKPEKVKPPKVEKPKAEWVPHDRVKLPGIKHPIPWGWIALALVIVVAVVGFLIKEREIDSRLSKPKVAAPVAAAAIQHMSCDVDKAMSANPLADAGHIEFDFDLVHACVNGRTPYERQANGELLRFTTGTDNPVAARMELSADGSLFTRYDYRLDPAQYQTFVAQKNALGSLRCSANADAGALAALGDNLARIRTLSLSYLTMPAETKTVWRCKAV